MLKITDLKIREDISDEQLLEIACKKFRINKNDIVNWHITKKSIDARKKDDVYYNYSLAIKVKDETKYPKLDKILDETSAEPLSINRTSKLSPVIIGSGPAGIFAALTFVQNGFKPIVVEQGMPVKERKKCVDEFIHFGKLNTNCNIQFGEGGAGTFSDGKLTTNINNPLCKKVLTEFCNFGAPEQILYTSKPHIGTDNLVNIIENMRNYIISQGGKFLFNTKFVDFETKNNKIAAAICCDLNNLDCTFEIPTDTIILAIGHSARDTFEMLKNKNISLKKKNFSVGVRIEHLQDMVNKSQYGTITKLKLPAADYKLAYHNTKTGRSCYTFCMCPGGYVMASSSERNTIVTNGMSTFARDGLNSNSAILVNVTPEDFKDDNPLAGMYFQKELEEKAFKLGGCNYFAPIQRTEDFLNNMKSNHIGIIKPTYTPGVTLCNLNTILPNFVSSTLKEGILYFDKKLSGFAHPDSILTGVETRSSSPVTIVRNENFVSNIDGIYPCGEGAGYAGGIMTAAVDGIKCANMVITKN